jgi:hypothetical protein
MTHLASLDFMELIRDHLRILGCLAVEAPSPQAAPSSGMPASTTHASAASSSGAAKSPQARATDAAAAPPGANSLAGSASAGSSYSRLDSGSRTSSAATMSLHQMCDCLSSIGHLLRLFCQSLQVLAIFNRSSVSQECMRPLLQLVSSPDIITTLVRLTFSPQMRAAASVETHALSDVAMSNVSHLRVLLGTFRSITYQACDRQYAIQHTIWQGLQMGAILTLQHNAPYLEPLLFLPTPAGGGETTAQLFARGCSRTQLSQMCVVPILSLTVAGG